MRKNTPRRRLGSTDAVVLLPTDRLPGFLTKRVEVSARQIVPEHEKSSGPKPNSRYSDNIVTLSRDGPCGSDGTQNKVSLPGIPIRHHLVGRVAHYRRLHEEAVPYPEIPTHPQKTL